MGKILNPFYEAVAWVLMRIHALLSVPFGPASGWAWGLSIVFLVMVMRLIMVPLFVKQMHSQRKMAALAPQVGRRTDTPRRRIPRTPSNRRRAGRATCGG